MSTPSNTSDIFVSSEAIENINGNIDSLFADGGYDSKSSYQLTHPKTKIIIPPRKSAVKDSQIHQRNQSIDYINEHTKSKWKREYNYHQRALVDNLFIRWKRYCPN